MKQARGEPRATGEMSRETLAGEPIGIVVRVRRVEPAPTRVWAYQWTADPEKAIPEAVAIQ